MSLPWVPLYLDAYTGDTMHLTCEEHGAYLQLMLAYYRSEKPLPASDRSLAAIVKLPMDRWMESKPTLAAFFREEGGLWHHDRIEAEIKDRSEKHAQSIARAKAGAAVMHARKGHRSAQSSAQATPVVSQTLADLHLQKKESLSVDVLTVKKDNSGDNSQDIPPEPVTLDIGTPVDPKFWPCTNHLAACKFDGADNTIIKREVDAFIAVKQQDGALSKDWDASWSLWWKRWKDHRDTLAAKEAAKAAPKPRIEVSNKIDWDAHAKRFAGGMGWPRGVGPDPDSPACRCPPDILERHGIAVLAVVKEKT